MKRSKHERRVNALEIVKARTFEQSRAHRKGSSTREEWQIRKDAEISHLEELINGRKY